VNKHPIIPLILEWRSLAKLKSTYIDALPSLINAKTGRIHTTFNQTVTSTGRLSSHNPNLQNIPIRTERGRDIRKAFVASDENTVIMSADYSQVELRIVADICKDERMIETFKKGEDIHASMAAYIYNVPQSEVTALMRRNAKTVNFGILYGISAFGLADRLHIPQREARDLINDYFNSFPKISEYLDNTIQFAKEKGYVETLLGRRRYIRDIDSHNAILRKAAERNAINAPIQGTAADLIKVSMNHIYEAIREKKLQSKMILQVHDELVFEVPKSEIDLMRSLVKELMENAMHLTVALSVEINEGKSWYEAH
jgi:DNA polymerase-1